MMFSKVTCLAVLALAAPVLAHETKEPTTYYASLGKFGTFELTISADDGTMTWHSDLQKIDELAEALGIDEGIHALNYHLHQSWSLEEDYAIGGDACGLANLGNHYDPFFACGPASGNSNELCDAIGRPRAGDRYSCSGSYELGEFDECEVGDLSGKEGALTVNDDFTASGGPNHPDPLAALNVDFVDERGLNPPDNFASILFHNGSPRVLCGKLFKDSAPQPPPEYPPAGNEFIDPSEVRDSIRSPCPAINMLANHGFINRDGRNVAVTDLVRELQNNFPVIPEFAVGAANGARNLGLFDEFEGVEVLNLDRIHERGVLEHDASITRIDQIAGDHVTGFNVSPELEARLLDSTDSDVLTREELKVYHASRVREGLANTADFRDTFTSGTPSAQMTLLMAFGQDPTFETVSKDITRSIFFREEVPAKGYNPATFPFLLDFAADPFMTVREEFRASLDAVLAENPDCELEFVLFDADSDTSLRVLEAEECIMDNSFSVQARPTEACPTTLSASMQLSGPIGTERNENSGPYMIFGDRDGDIFGRNYEEGSYSISSQIFSERFQGGDLVVEGTFDFTVKDCRRRLRIGS